MLKVTLDENNYVTGWCMVGDNGGVDVDLPEDLTAIDGVTMKMLVERIIARENSIEVVFKCGVSIEKEYVR